MNYKRSWLNADYIFWIYALSLILSQNTFFTWSTYNVSIIKYIAYVIEYGGIILMFIYAFLYKKFNLILEINQFISFILLIFLIVHMDIFGVKYTRFPGLSDLLVISTFLVMLKLESKELNKLFNCFITIFAIVSLPSLIYFLLSNAGVNLTYNILNSTNALKVQSNISYLHYPFGLIIRDFGGVNRYCAIFDEPGVVGTISALLFAGGWIKKTNKKILLLIFIEGFFSFSMAFYLLILVFAITEAFNKGAIKFGIAFCTVIVALIIIANIKTNNIYIINIQSRLDFSSGLVVNNRTNLAFDGEFKKFLSGPFRDLLFGEGRAAYTYNTYMRGLCSYKCIIYDHGIVGTLLYLLLFVFMGLSCHINKKTWPFALTFLVSLYQRPYVITMFYLTLYYCALFTKWSDEKVEFTRNIETTRWEKSAQRVY